MKVEIHVFCLFALFAVVYTQSEEEIIKVTEECQKKVQATKDELKVLDDLDAVPKTQNEFCLIACFYKRTGVMDANNKIVYEKAILELEPLKKKDQDMYDKYIKFVKECTDEVKPTKDECETMKIYTECVSKKEEEL